jgi:hypothetical protein
MIIMGKGKKERFFFVLITGFSSYYVSLCASYNSRIADCFFTINKRLFITD